MCYPAGSFDTTYKALQNLRKTKPDHPMLGTNKGPSTAKGVPGGYEWMTCSQVVEKCERFAAGAQALGLAPAVAGENGDTWRFLGV